MSEFLLSLLSAAAAYGLAYFTHAVHDSAEHGILKKVRDLKGSAALKKALEDLFADHSKDGGSKAS